MTQVRKRPILKGIAKVKVDETHATANQLHVIVTVLFLEWHVLSTQDNMGVSE